MRIVGTTALALSSVLMLAFPATLARADTVAGKTSAAPAGPVTAAVVAWDSYFRQGPGWNYPVLDEVSRDTEVALLGCARGWCRIGYGGLVGYVQQGVVTAPGKPQPAEQAQRQHDCFWASTVEFDALDGVRFCAVSSKGAP